MKAKEVTDLINRLEEKVSALKTQVKADEAVIGRMWGHINDLEKVVTVLSLSIIAYGPKESDKQKALKDLEANQKVINEALHRLRGRSGF